MQAIETAQANYNNVVRDDIDLCIWLGNGYRNIKLTDKVRTSKAVYSFCQSNGLRHAVVKAGTGWYIIQFDGTLKYWCRALAYVTFEDLYLVLTMKQYN
jgi:hypothetical protein